MTAARLTRGRVGRQLLRLGAPMVVGIASISAFNLADTWFVGRLGAAELAAMGFTFPVVMLVGSVSLGLGVGTTSVLSRTIGAGRTEQARRVTTDSLLFAVGIVLLLALAGSLTIDPLFRLLGADDRTLPLVRSYMRVWYVGMAFVVVPMVGNSALRATGDTRTPAAIMLAAAVLNVLLDPVLIFGLGPVPRLGLAGAAWATVAARGLTLALALWVLQARHHLLAGLPRRAAEVLRSWTAVLRVGVPAAATNTAVPITIAVLTRILAGFGPAGVAAYGAGARVLMFSMIPAIALTSGLAPFVGQNWGAGERGRVARGLRLAMGFAGAWGLACWAVLGLGAGRLAGLFSEDPAVVTALADFLRIGPSGLAAQGLFMAASTTFNAINRPGRAAALSLIRAPLGLVVLAWLGGRLAGIPGVFAGFAASNYVVGGVAWAWTRALRRQEAEPLEATR